MFISPAVAGDAVLIGSCSGSLYALDRSSGDPIWAYDTATDGASAQFHGEPLILGDRLIIPTDAFPRGHLYAFDLTSGDVAWKVPFPRGVAATPLLLGSRLVVVSAEGEVAAVEAKSGTVLWRVSPAGALKERHVSSPALAANRILFADNIRHVLALDPSNGATLWKTTLQGRPNTSLIAIGGDLVAGTDDGYLNWIDVKSGALKKRTKLGGMPYGTPIESEGLLFILVSTGRSKLLALDLASGKVRWEQETPREWTTYRPLVTGPVIIAGNEEKDLCAFDRRTGKTRWCHPVGQVPRGLGVSKDGVLFVGALSGMVQAFRVNQ